MQFPAQFNLSELNGSNGFVLKGIDADDLSGWSVSSAGDINGDGLDDLIIGALSAGSVDEGQSYVVFGSSSGFNSNLELSTLDGSNGFVINGINSGEISGTSVSSAGDINGDGIDDVIIGAPGGSFNTSSKSYVIFGSSSGFGSTFELSTLDGSNGFVINGIDSNDQSGVSVSDAEDVNGDGVDDVIIGARYADPNGSKSGESYVIFGSSSGFGSSFELSSLDGTNGFVINGIDADDRSGESVSSAGDINGDGINDLIIGAEKADPNGTDSGESYVVFGSSSGFSPSLELSSLDGSNGFVINGINSGDNSGQYISSAGDINADGIDDLIIGARFADPNGIDRAGEAYVVFGSSSGFGSSLELSSLNGSNGFILNGIDADDLAGSVSSAGDFNGDGINDLIIGANTADSNGFSSGESYVVFGSSSGFGSSLELSSLNGANGFILNGIDAGDFSGRPVSDVGDINGDGVDDLIIAAVGADPNGSSSGESYVVFGNTIPIAVDDTITTSEDNTLTGNVFADNGNGADNDPKDDTFTVTEVNDTDNPADVGNQITLPSGAFLTLNSDGTFNYNPNGQFEPLNNGQTANDTFSYTIADDKIGFSIATVNITINGVNDIPVLATNTGLTVDEDAVGNISATQLQVTDVDNTATEIIYTITNLPLNGNLLLNGTALAVNDTFTQADIDNNLLTYDHNGSETTSDNFDFTVVDGADGSINSQTFNITVNPINDAPVANDDIATTDEDSSISISVLDLLANDTDLEGDSLTITAVDDRRTKGNITFDGVNITYDPKGEFEFLNDGQTANDSFTYTISDGNGGTDTGTVNITINGVSGDIFPAFPDQFNLSDLNGSNGFVINGIDAGDISGFSVSDAGDINGDGIDDLIIGAFGADPNGESYVVFGSSSGFSSSLELSDLDGSNGFVINGIDSGDFFGTFVSDAGDINGDGVDDLIIAAPDNRLNGLGKSYVVFGSSSGFGSSLELSNLDGSNGFVINTINPVEFLLGSVSSAGDINGDGLDDLIIGASLADSSGESYVVFGSSSGFSSTLDLSSLDGSNGFVLNGIDAGDESGRSVSSAGDVNGDGIDDLIIGANGADPSGESYVVFGSSSGFGSSFDLSSLDGSNGFVLNGIDAGDESGRSVSSAGDINGDGIDDLIIGAYRADPNASGSGESYVVFGSSSGFDSSFKLSSLDGSNGFVLNGIGVGDSSGFSVSNAGDVNGDGLDDIIIGAYLADPNGQFDAGESYVVFGSSSGFDSSFNLSSLDGSNGFILNGIDTLDESGFSVSSAGDINNDGVDDLIIGAFESDPNGNSRAGESYVVFGNTIPIAVDDTITTSEDNALTGNVFADNGNGADSETKGEIFTVTEVNGTAANVGNQITLASGALLTLNSDGTFNYDPNGQFESLNDGETASDSFTYTIADSKIGSNTATVNITINGVNDAPSVEDATFSIAENSADGTSIGTVTGSDPDTSDTLTYAITAGNIDPDGDSNAAFAIDSSTGEITVADSGDLDFETNKNFNLTVTATDAEGLSDDAAIAINLTDVNELPIITSNPTFSISENTTTVGTIIASDVDGDSLTYSISGGVDSSLFAIDPTTGDLTFINAPDFETPTDADTDNNYQVQVSVSDGTETVTQDLTVTVEDVNELPIITSSPAFSISENTTTVGTIIATDGDGDSLTYSIGVGVDSSLFAVDETTGDLTFINAPDFEAPTDTDTDNNYQVQVAVSDGIETVTQDLTVTVEDVNEAPTADDATFTVDENSDQGTEVGTVTGSDPDAGDTLTYAITSGNIDPDGDSNAAFAIDSSTGEITVLDSGDLDFETTPNFNLTVTATDAEGLSDDAAIAINLTDVVDGKISGVKWDDENGNGFRDSELIQGSNPDVIFVVDTSGSTGNPFQGKPVGNVNGVGNPDTILDAELAGFIALNQQLIDQGLEDIAEVGIVAFAGSAAQVDMNPAVDGVQLTTTPNADNNNNGKKDVQEILESIVVKGLGVSDGTNFEAALQGVQNTFTSLGTVAGDGNVVFLSDGEPDPNNKDFTDEVTELTNQSINLSAFGVGNGSSLTELQKIDPDAEIFTTTDELLGVFGNLNSDGSQNNFTETGLAGVEIYLDLNNNGVLDTDEPSTITATDDPNTPEDETGYYEFINLSAGNYVVREVVPEGYVQTSPEEGFYEISLGQNPIIEEFNFGNDEINTPPIITSEPEFQVPENTLEVGTITATDAEDDDLTFSITDGKDKELFAIDPNSGILSFINPPNFDVDAETNYQVQVSVSDGNETVSQDLTVNLTAVEEPPIIEDTTFFVGTNSTSGTTIGMVTATDPENKELEFAITSGNIDSDGDSNQAFAIDSSTGIVTINDIDDLDFASTSNLNLEVTATDADNLSYTANIPINLEDSGALEKEFLDLSDVTGEISVSVEVQREAAFDNVIGFYQITNANGGIDTNGDGVADFNPGDAGYKQAALNNRITGLDLLQTENQTTSTFNGTLDGGTILAPFIIVDGTFDQALNGSAEVYFSFLGANSDGFDHIRSLGSENTLGFEDLPGGGDLDYNDVILRIEY